MNKAVFALVLVGLVVLATAVEAGAKDKMEKMKMKKAKAMAKKEHTSMAKLKDLKIREGIKRMEALAGSSAGDARRRGHDAISRAYAALKQQLANKDITSDEFQQQARLIKDQAKREMAEGQTRQEESRKDQARNKRAVGEAKESMKKRRASLKSAKAVSSKLRRGEN